MLDDIRRQANSAYDEEDAENRIKQPSSKPRRPRIRIGAFQRFFIALILLMLVCLLGSLCLLATGRVVPPF